MRFIIITSSVILLILVLPVYLNAQEESPVLPGTRVRISAPRVATDRILGTVISMDANTLVLKSSIQLAPVSIPLRSINKFEVSKGQKSKVVTGIVNGFIIGAPAGALLGGVRGGYDDVPTAAVAVSGAVIGGLLGAGTGGIIGRSQKTDRWEEVPLERIRLGVGSYGERGLVLSASFAF